MHQVSHSRGRWSVIAVIGGPLVVTILMVVDRFAPVALGQAPQSASLPPGGAVTLTVPPGGGTGPGPATPSVVEVINQSDRPATVTYDGNTLTIAVPAGFAVRVAPWVPGATCDPVGGQPNHVLCKVDGRPPARVSFTTVALAPQATPAPVILPRTGTGAQADGGMTARWATAGAGLALLTLAAAGLTVYRRTR